MSLRSLARTALIASAVLAFASVAVWSQATASRWGSSKGLGFGNVDRSTLNNHIEIPIYSRPTVGQAQVNLRLTYDSNFWTAPAGGYGYWEPGDFGWKLVQPYGKLTTEHDESDEYCGFWNDDDQDYDKWFNLVWDQYTFTEPDGTFVDTGLPVNEYLVAGGGTHQVGDEPSDCPDFVSGSTLSQTLPDGKGYTIVVTDSGGPSATVAAYDSQNDEIDGEFKDRNGNQVTVATSGGDTYYYDPLSAVTPALTQSGTGPVDFTYTGANGSPTTIEEKFESFGVTTAFGCGHYTEWSGTATVPSELDMDNGTKYLFGYDSIGRLTSVTLPTGAVVHYSYTLDCTDDGNSALTRWDSVNGSGHGWSWGRTQEGSGTVQTVETDPEGNDGVFSFAAPQWTGESGALTEADFYQGTHTGGTEMESATVTDSITSQYVSQQTTAVKVFGTTPVYRESAISYDALGSKTVESDYDWGTSSPSGGIMRQTTTAFTLVDNVFDEVSSVTVTDGSSTAAKTTYSYDGNGNPTAVHSYSGSSSYLTNSYTYNTNGTVATATDPGGETDYTYDATDGCGLFPTEVQNHTITAVKTTATWDCTGGVMKTSTDANGGMTTYTYEDAANTWRPSSIEDAGGNTTAITYPNATTPDVGESVMNFNGGSSTSDVVTTVDGLGRTVLSQRDQTVSGGTYDSVAMTYDWMDRPSTVSVPFSAAKGAATPGGTAVTTTTYDALSRPVEVLDGGGGEVDTSYSGNDVLQSVAAASPENAKMKQMEYDGLGNARSVCEIVTNTGAGTPTPGSGTCGQVYSANGYWTKYTRNALSEITAVSQNAQSGSPQSRSFGFDELGRLTSETNPESGTTDYYFDTDSTCGLTSGGDLIRKLDANGNSICYAHDALHRVTAITYPGGNPNATASKTFVYDAATVDSTAMAKTVGRLAEAYTGSHAVDEGFSYDALGQVSDAYQSSAHSGGWYVTAATGYPNGGPATLSVPGVPLISYGADGEGRPTTATADGSPPQPLVSSTSYGEFGLTGVTLGSSDSDSYDYWPTTGRMKDYVFSVNSVTDTGVLTWNANGSLGTLAITDNISGTSDSQSCSYTHDDLGRLWKADCGAGLNQSYALDAFGNLKTTGTPSGLVFNPSSFSNNRIGGETYDSDGNLLDDPVTPAAGVNAFDAEGKAVTLEGIAVVYDALGRAVEAAKSGGTVEFVYGPGGGKLAVMSGQTLLRADIPLPGGGEAVYGSYGLAYYRHADGLGSDRLGSTPGRALDASAAYAPYGAAYDPGGAGDTSFTGQKQDIDASLSGGQYDFLLREYNSIQGRWWTPDPAGLGAVNPNNPQSWNRYGYVNGTPLEATDPLGLLTTCPVDPVSGEPVCDPGDPWGQAGGGGGTGGGGGGGNCISPLGILAGHYEAAFRCDGPGGGAGAGGGGGVGGSNTTAITTQPPEGPNCGGTSANFVEANASFGAQIAGAAKTSAANILGLAALESGWGTSNLAVNYGNYFGLEYGPNFPGTVGQYHSPNGNTYGIYAAPGFLDSGLSFANSSFGRRVQGAYDPTAFVQALQGGGHAYNSENLSTPYGQQLLAEITQVAAILATCLGRAL